MILYKHWVQLRSYLGKVWSWARRHWVLLAIMGAGIVFYAAIALIRYYGMHDGTYDLVIFYQAISGYAHFEAPSSFARGVDNLLADHFHPILVLLAPLLWIWNSPVVLVLAQVLILVSAVPAVYLFARERLGSHKQALLMAACALFAPGVLLMVQFDFHELAFAVPLLSWAMYALHTERWKLLVWMIIGLLLTKENLSLLVVVIGIILLIRRKYIGGLLAVLTGIGWFFLVTKLISPWLSGGVAYNYWVYTSLGSGPASAAKHVIMHPVDTVIKALTPLNEKALLLAKTFVPVLGLSIFSPYALFLVPLLGERLFSGNPNHWEFGYHYQALLGSVVLIAAIDSVARIRKWIKPKNKGRLFQRLVISVFALMTGLMMLYVMRFTYSEDGYGINTARYKEFTDFQKRIPRGVRVCTTNYLGAYIHERRVAAVEWMQSADQCDVVVYGETTDGGVETIKRQLGTSFSNEFTLAHQQGVWRMYLRQ